VESRSKPKGTGKVVRLLDGGSGRGRKGAEKPTLVKKRGPKSSKNKGTISIMGGFFLRKGKKQNNRSQNDIPAQ